MNKIYTRYSIEFVSEEQKDLLIAILCDYGIEGFEEEGSKLFASGSNDLIREEDIEAHLSSQKIVYQKTEVADQNWNAIWESSFEPVQVEDFVGIRADFHPPLTGVMHEIVITPKMSFGTGHHATTWLVMQMMRDLEFINTSVFDFGTGTGILAILAEKLGAQKVVAVDYDEWCIENARENLERNNCHKINLYQADAPPEEEQFDILLANINKNIILQHFSKMVALVRPDGCMVLSGLLSADEWEISDSAIMLGLKFVKKLEKDGWIALFYSRPTPKIKEG